jgi:AbrB family looped-hinge helix DNA binding protein
MAAPKGKHLFGTVKVGEKGQIVIPKEARDIFGIQPGDSLVVLGDEASGLAILKNDVFLAQVADAIFQQAGSNGASEAQLPPEGAATFEEIKGLASKKAGE